MDNNETTMPAMLTMPAALMYEQPQEQPRDQSQERARHAGLPMSTVIFALGVVLALGTLAILR